MQNQSEVARLLERIGLEYQAGKAALYSTAIAAPHQFISARMENIFHTQKQIALIVGDDEANHLVTEHINAIPDEDLIPHIEDSLRNGASMENNDALVAAAVRRLQGILDELNTMPVLPLACTPEAMAMHGEWIAQHKKAEELIKNAERIALWAIPSEVALLLEQVHTRRREIHPINKNLRPTPPAV